MISFYDIFRQANILPIGQGQRYMLANDGGNPIIGFKTLLKAEFKSAGKTVFEPIEENSFATYNKTTEPKEFYFEVALQYPNQDFGAVLSTLEELKKGTDVFTFTTPFTAYSDLTLEGYSTLFEGATSMLIIGLQCKEVIQVTQGYTNVEIENPKNPSDTGTSNTGKTGTRAGTDEEKQKAEESEMVIILGDEDVKNPTYNDRDKTGDFGDDGSDDDDYQPD